MAKNLTKVRGKTNLPPETGVDGSSATEHATGHLVGISAGNTSRVNPDLVAEAGNVEAGEVGANEPLGLHGASITTGRRGSLLDQQNALASLAELIRERDTTGTSTDNDVVVGLGRCGRADRLILLALTRGCLEAEEVIREWKLGC